jgi:hypothetical protein
MTAAKKALIEAEASPFEAKDRLQGLTANLERELNPIRRRLPLTDEQIASQASLIPLFSRSC